MSTTHTPAATVNGASNFYTAVDKSISVDLVISSEMFASLPPLYQGVARVLQREGKVKISDAGGVS